MTNVTLPKNFEMLEPLVPTWALATQNERQARRIGSSRGALQAFYDAMLPRMPALLEHVDKFPLGQLPEDSKRLFHLALSLAEVAPHVELYGGDPKVPHSFDETRFVADFGHLPD